MYHTAGHHGMCMGGGDWYGCKMRQLYEPMMYANRVNMMVGGHSHHYQRSHPMYKQQVDANGIVHIVIGTGGFELTGENWSNTPEWLAYRQGSYFGFGRFRVANATHFFWEHVSSSKASLGKILDSAWITRS